MDVIYKCVRLNLLILMIMRIRIKIDEEKKMKKKKDGFISNGGHSGRVTKDE